MRIRCVPASKLSEQQLRTWSDLQRGSESWFSPFLRPEFTQAVAAVRDNVEVAVWEDGERCYGFMPFQRSRWNTGLPVAAGLNEFQAAVVDPRVTWTARQFITQSGLLWMKFDHLVTAQDVFEPHHTIVGESPYMDLSQGFSHYCLQRRAAGSSVIEQTNRKARKLAREVGPVRFERHRGDEKIFEKLLLWKSMQHERTGVLDVFRFDWVVQLLRQVRDANSDDFQGDLSVLYAADRPVAVHLGLRTRRAAHLWYPAYDPEFSAYSPGMILFLELARWLADHGVQRFDFGPGPQRYKRSLMTDATNVAQATVDRFPTVQRCRGELSRARNWVRSRRLPSLIRSPARAVSRLQRWVTFREGNRRQGYPMSQETGEGR